jgi:uncharacterized protein YecE (DUF72 family)
MSIEVGISGWNYQGWRGSFYPQQMPLKQQLAYASRQLPSIEINGTFYSLQRPSSYQRWYEATPENFIFSVKANRYITHLKRLNEIEIPLANFFASGIFRLKEKLGPILWQFPPSMVFDPEKFEKFLQLLPHDTISARHICRLHQLPPDRVWLPEPPKRKIRHAIEVRHHSFMNPWFIELLRQYQVALVVADTAGKWPYMEDITADFVYVRLHGDSELYVSGYHRPALNFWSRRIELWSSGQEPPDRLTITDNNMSTEKQRDVYVYFDNDAKVRAPGDAAQLISIIARHEKLRRRKEA